MGAVNVQGFFVLINECQGFVVWEEGSLRLVVLIFFILAIRVSSKRTVLTWSWEIARIRSWKNLWKRLNKQGPKVSRRMIKMNGPRRGKSYKSLFCSHRVEL